MNFRLLGPLEVAERDRPLSLGGVKQRSVLAVLLLHANEVVSTDHLIDELWGDAPPARASKTIQVYMSRLRKELGADRLVTRPPGYQLLVQAGELDLARFEQLSDEARTAGPEEASSKLQEALALWHGPALADLAYEAFAQAEVARLEEMRLAVVEQRIDAELALGRHAEVVGDLEALVRRHPLRERLRGQLMLALYRSARQAEALEVYRAARRELAEELGLEPSDQLQRMEQAILLQDPSLDLGATEPAAAAVPLAVAHRAVLVAPSSMDAVDALLHLARPFAAGDPPRELIVAGVVAPDELHDASAALAERRDALLADGVSARTAAFSSPSVGEDIARLALQEGVDVLLMDAGDNPLGGDARVVLEGAPCDVALLVTAGGSLRDGPVIVPFGAATHDWTALELGAWVARATGAPLRLIGAASEARDDGRDASRLLADASLIVQRTAGIVAEPLLASPGRSGVAALAEGAGLLVVGLSERWSGEGLGRVRAELAGSPPAPMVFVRRGARPGGLAPPETRTRFSWSLTGSAG
jgi:DNA-binding SARP family transcriptional activator